MFLNILQNSQENTFGLRHFQKHIFYKTPLDNCFWLFLATLLKWGTTNNVWKTSDEYSLSRNTNLRSTFQVYPIISFFGRINFQCMSSLVYTVRCSVKKGVLKDFIGKHLCWSLFLIKLTPILKNICQRLLLHCTGTTHCYLSVLLYIQHLLPHHHCYYC